jgi:hypothetical protein
VNHSRAEAVRFRHRSEEAMNLVQLTVQVPAGSVALDADLVVPEPASGVVLLNQGRWSRSPGWPGTGSPII